MKKINIVLFVIAILLVICTGIGYIISEVSNRQFIALTSTTIQPTTETKQVERKNYSTEDEIKVIEELEVEVKKNNSINDLDFSYRARTVATNFVNLRYSKLYKAIYTGSKSDINKALEELEKVTDETYFKYQIKDKIEEATVGNRLGEGAKDTPNELCKVEDTFYSAQKDYQDLMVISVICPCKTQYGTVNYRNIKIIENDEGNLVVSDDYDVYTQNKEVN